MEALLLRLSYLSIVKCKLKFNFQIPLKTGRVCAREVEKERERERAFINTSITESKSSQGNAFAGLLVIELNMNSQAKEVYNNQPF